MKYLGSTLLDLEGGMVSGRIAQLFEWMMMEFTFLFAILTQLATHLSLLLVSSSLPGLPLPLTLEELHPLKRHVSSYVNGHETPHQIFAPWRQKMALFGRAPRQVESSCTSHAHTKPPAHHAQDSDVRCERHGQVIKQEKTGAPRKGQATRRGQEAQGA
jgi:hypothetical protein